MAVDNYVDDHHDPLFEAVLHRIAQYTGTDKINDYNYICD